MSEPSPRAVLNHLIETCKDAERGFRHAESLVHDPAMKSEFAGLAERRGRFAGDLVPHAQRLGGDAAAEGTAGAAMHRRWMDVRDRMSGHDDGAVVAEVRRGDAVTLLAFKNAVEGVLPATVRDLIEQEYAAMCVAHERIDVLERSQPGV